MHSHKTPQDSPIRNSDFELLPVSSLEYPLEPKQQRRQIDHSRPSKVVRCRAGELCRAGTRLRRNDHSLLSIALNGLCNESDTLLRLDLYRLSGLLLLLLLGCGSSLLLLLGCSCSLLLLLGCSGSLLLLLGCGSLSLLSLGFSLGGSLLLRGGGCGICEPKGRGSAFGL